MAVGLTISLIDRSQRPEGSGLFLTSPYLVSFVMHCDKHTSPSNRMIVPACIKLVCWKPAGTSKRKKEKNEPLRKHDVCE